jgi:MerR family transcriptional regulator/heat shock protein HspR
MEMAKREDRQGRAVYIISVAAELAGMHPQTLRIYERKGLLRPARTAGNTRRYSDRDIDRLRRINELTQLGVNLAGVKMIMDMQAKLERVRREVEEMNRELEQARKRLEHDSRGSRSDILPMRSTRLPWQESS